MTASGRSASMALITGTTLRASSSCGTGSEPGRVDSPPTSIISAPSSSMAAAREAAFSGTRKSPPSEKESGVTLRTPTSTGSGPRVRSPAPSVLRGSREELRTLPRLYYFTRSFLFSRVVNLLPVTVRVAVAGGAVGVDLVHGVLLYEAHQVVGVDSLVLDQLLRELVEEGPVAHEEVLSQVVGLVHDASDLLVYLEGDLVGVVRLVVEVSAHKDLSLLVPQRHRPELLAHPETGDHLPRGLRNPLEVV